ncbi:DUF6882 domain-containing protein [Actinoallomurus iriomotensis]|nr:DUF6882 domain-containing protein [Actinoallomurus iriomotensis]
MSGFSPAFDRLGAAYAAISAQQQEALVDFLPAADWSADLATGTYTQGEVTLKVALLGSYAEENRSWLWGWANPQFGPDHPAVVNPTAIGARLAIAELTARELDLSWYDGPARSGGDIVAMAATGLIGSPGTIPGSYEGGVAYFAIQDASAPVPGWDSLTAPRMITSGLTLFPADHRLTVSRFFSHHRLAFREDETSIVAALPEGGTCVAEFDEEDRFVSLSMELVAR